MQTRRAHWPYAKPLCSEVPFVLQLDHRRALRVVVQQFDRAQRLGEDRDASLVSDLVQRMPGTQCRQWALLAAIALPVIGEGGVQ